MIIKVDENTVIVFDLDDTLYNELDYLKSAYEEIAQHISPKNHKELYAQMLSIYRENKNVFEFLCDKYKLRLEGLLTIYRNHKPNIKLKDGALEIIRKIKSKNGKIAIVTDGRYATQMTKIKALKLSDFVDKIVISEEIGSEKPSLKNFSIVEENLTGKLYYYIADNLKKDFLGPNQLGWKTVCLIDSGCNIHNNTNKYLKDKYKPQKFINSFNEINVL